MSTNSCLNICVGRESVGRAPRAGRIRLWPDPVLIHHWPLMVALAGLLASSVAAEDMPRAVSERVRRATVLVITEIPGTKEGGSGTGEFINNNGLLITNNHVVDPNHGKSREERAKTFHKITLPKYHVIVDSGTRVKKEYEAELIFQSEPTDLALLQLKKDSKERGPQTPCFLRFCPEGGLREGLKVWVFGFPGGLSRDDKVATTGGLVTELLRSQSGLVHYVESDATVHPGNSGGPFVDASGYLVGVATHKRFSEGEKDRSGAVPIHLVEDFLRTAFYEDRVPRTVNVLPFIDIFTDQDGVVEFPAYPRDSTDSTIYYRSGNQVRRGEILAQTLPVTTELGRIKVDLGKAAYLFVGERVATLIMDGGDYLTFPYGGTGKLPVDLAGNKRNLALDKIDRIAFPRPEGVVKYPQAEGVVLEADGTRLGLSQIQGAVSISGSTFPLPNVASIESEDKGRQVLATADGQRLPGKVGGDPIRARTVWASEPIALSLAAVTRATVRPVDWTYVNAKGRRLIDRLELDDEDLGRIAVLLDSPGWREGLPLLEQAAKARGRDRKSKRNLKLMQGVAQWRAGEYEAARSVLKRLKSGRDQVRWIAESYQMLLDEHPDHNFRGQPLSEPDVAWRASTYKARAVLHDARRRYEQALELEYDKNAKELKDLEGELEAANRLELGVAQSLLMEVLRAQAEAHWQGYSQMAAEYNELVQMHNRQRHRAQQHKFARKLRSLEKKLRLAEKEGLRVYQRYSADVTGFRVEPPKFE